MTETRQRKGGREEEGECPLQRGQKTQTAVTLTLSEREKIERKRQKELCIVSDAMTDGYYYSRENYMYINTCYMYGICML